MTVSSAQLLAAMTALETAAGGVTSANDSESGRWKRIAAASETLAAATTSANDNVSGYMLRTAAALEVASETSTAAANRSYSGLLLRIVNALEALGEVGVGSLGHRFELGAEGASFSSPSAAWPALVGPEMMENGDCSSGTGWTLSLGITIAAGKQTWTAISSGADASNSGPSAAAIILGATYRCGQTYDSISGGALRQKVGGVLGASISTAGAVSQDIVAGDPAEEGGWAIEWSSGTTTAQLDNFSVKSIGLMGVSTYWTVPGGSLLWNTASQGLQFSGADQSAICSITGDGLTAFTAAVSLNTAVLFRVFVAEYIAGGDASVRIHNGSWEPLNFLADGWSTPIAVTTGAVAGLDFRGNASGTSEFIIRACDIDLA